MLGSMRLKEGYLTHEKEGQVSRKRRLVSKHGLYICYSGLKFKPPDLRGPRLLRTVNPISGFADVKNVL
jgi:hypothetical protein